MPNKVIRNERRIQILEALHACLLEKPFHQTTIKDIAQKADVNHGMLHYYFENKEDILLKYIEYTFNKYFSMFVEQFNNEFKESIADAYALEDQLHWALHEIAFNQESAKIFTEIWALALYNPKVMKKLRKHYRKWNDKIFLKIKGYVKDETTAARLSLTMIAILEGMSLFSIIFDKKDLCTDINYGNVLSSLAPQSNIRFR
jgi:AcrR family transcriptional regulator